MRERGDSEGGGRVTVSEHEGGGGPGFQSIACEPGRPWERESSPSRSLRAGAWKPGTEACQLRRSHGHVVMEVRSQCNYEIKGRMLSSPSRKTARGNLADIVSSVEGTRRQAYRAFYSSAGVVRALLTSELACAGLLWRRVGRPTSSELQFEVEAIPEVRRGADEP